ncbi:50S ribosomal protein L20 [Patescibacteria group bacterium]|jgi:large subunit ribosomal protein L20|nr:50S ribosomal protein L20 [Candidatus Dojkabacteria bacterium]CAG1022933.1 50S ribosomal protein L20 [Patescibacteria group bacterium]
MRIKRGVTKRQKKKQVLEQAKGYRMTYHKLYRRAKEATLHAGQYSYAHRRRRRSQVKNEWVRIISAALVNTELSYSKFMNALSTKNITLDRKILSELAVFKPEQFAKVVEIVKA